MGRSTGWVAWAKRSFAESGVLSSTVCLETSMMWMPTRRATCCVAVVRQVVAKVEETSDAGWVLRGARSGRWAAPAIEQATAQARVSSSGRSGHVWWVTFGNSKLSGQWASSTGNPPLRDLSSSRTRFVVTSSVSELLPWVGGCGRGRSCGAHLALLRRRGWPGPENSLILKVHEEGWRRGS